MDAIRKQLDVLMGANRNGDVAEVNRKYYDRDVCRLFLAGLCPHDLFQLTCERKIQRALKRLEDEDAKAAIAISVSKVTQTPEVIELSKQIKEKLKEADVFDFEGKTDSKIRVLEVVEELKAQRADKQSVLLLDAFNKDRASLPQPIQNPSPLATLPVLNPPDPHTQEMINEKLKKAEDLGEMGMIDEAQKALEEAEALKKLGARQEPVLESSKYSAADVRIRVAMESNIRMITQSGFVSQTDQKLRLLIGVVYSDRRLADHFGGKLHLGYMQIREKLAELQEERNKKRKIDRPEDDRRSKERSRDRDGAGSRDRDIDREVREAENTIEEIGIMIGIMIEIIETETEILIDLATMIQGVEEGHVLDQGIVAEIMTGIELGPASYALPLPPSPTPLRVFKKKKKTTKLFPSPCCFSAVSFRSSRGRLRFRS
ncbi:RNA-binding protein Luc7-like [Musa troglodytarum]|uniref:RNA-binding protein Luc7-like n=1 Tax=Musa troglodytarum TaxID=320322 RepID=A0A9E7GHH0_9LILI|nr:RNA-binding protein Luc7-like [Musa troglodytarum]